MEESKTDTPWQESVESIQSSEKIVLADSTELVSWRHDFNTVFRDDFLFETLLDFFSLDEILTQLYKINKKFKSMVIDANYLLMEKLMEKLSITSTFLTSDLAAKDSIINVYKNVRAAVEEGKIVDLKPNCFYTDSGIVGTNMWYSMHNIFETNTTMYYGYVFSSNKGTNNHIQGYLCNPGSYTNTFNQKLKSEFELTPGSKEIKVPYEKQPSDGSQATFKLPKVLEINCRNQGYWYYVDNFVLFFSESEVDNKKFQKSTALFDNVKSVEDVKNLGLPILSIDTETTGLTVIEFDLSK